MAELLTKIPTNLTEYPNSFKRQGCFPLEAYSVFYAVETPEGKKTAFEAAQEYATKNAIAYVGQTLAVVTTNTEDASIVDDVTFYIIADAAGTLQEVGKATNGDGNSISLNDGVLSLTGFNAAGAATLPQKSPVYKKDAEGNDTEEVDHYELKWVTIDAIVQGDGNTKTVVTVADGEGVAKVALVRDEDTDTNTYKISLDLSAYATSEAVGTAIKATEDKLVEAIGAASKPESAEGAGDAVAATGVYKAIEEAEARAKAYADANDADTIYDDTTVKNDIKAVGDRVTTLENTIGTEAGGLIKDIADNRAAIEAEATARGTAISEALDTAKDYADDIVVTIATKDGKEYIVISKADGTELTSVDATAFVKDGMLDAAEYSTETKKLALTWNTDAGKSSTIIDLNDLVNTYTAGDGIAVSTGGVISVTDDVARDSDLTSLETALNEVIATKRTETEVDAQIDAKITAANLGQYAKASDMETALGAKADQSTVEDLTEEVALKAVKTEVVAALSNKVDSATYASDMAKVAKTEDVTSQFTSIGQRIDGVEANVYSKEAADAKFATIGEGENDAATNADLAVVSQVANNAATKADNLEGKIKEITEVGGEPNSIEYIAVNGTKLTPSEDDKTVNIEIPVIANVKVSDLKDGGAFADQVNTNKTSIEALGTKVDGVQAQLSNEQTGLTVLNTRVAALETEVRVGESSRIDALEGQVAALIEIDTTYGTDISGLKNRATAVEAKAAANEAKLAGITTATVKEYVDGEVRAAKESVDLSSRVAVTDFEAYKTATAATLETKANAADVYSRTDADATFTTADEVKSIVNTVIAEVTDTDTLEGLVDLVEYVHENAADLVELTNTVNTHTADIAANKAAHEKNATDIASLVDAVTANEVKESSEISVAVAEGEGATGVQLGIKEINVNKLVQTTGDILILNGGSASV